MSKTDKTRPARVRLREIGAGEYELLCTKNPVFDVPRDFAWSNAERGIGPKYARWAKRMKSKKNRRRDEPWTQMRGHGWGETNYRINW